MRPDNIPVDYRNEIKFPEDPDRPPIRSFTTPRVKSDRGRFWIYVTIIGPITEKPKSYLPLSRTKAKDQAQAIADAVEFIEECLR